MADYTSIILKELNEKGIRKVSFLAGYLGRYETMVRWSNKTKRAFRRHGIPDTVQRHLLEDLAYRASPEKCLSARYPGILVRTNTATGSVSTTWVTHPYSPRYARGGY